MQYANAVSVAAGTSGELNLGTAYTAAEQVGNLTLNTGATLNVTRSGATTANSAYGITAGTVAIAGSSTINVANNGSGPGTLSLGALSGSGNLTLNGPGNVVLMAAANGFSGTTTLNGGTLVAANGGNGSASGSGLLTLNSGLLASDPTVGGAIGGSVAAGSGAAADRPRRHRRHRQPDDWRQPCPQQPVDARLRLKRHNGRRLEYQRFPLGRRRGQPGAVISSVRPPPVPIPWPRLPPTSR